MRAVTGDGGTILENVEVSARASWSKQFRDSHKFTLQCPTTDVVVEDGEPTKVPCAAKLAYGDDMKTLVQLQIDAKNDPDFTEPGRDINNARPTRKPEDNGFFIATSYKTTSFPLPPSSKLTVAMAVVTQWLTESPDDKIISKYTCFRYTTT